MLFNILIDAAIYTYDISYYNIVMIINATVKTYMSSIHSKEND